MQYTTFGIIYVTLFTNNDIKKNEIKEPES